MARRNPAGGDAAEILLHQRPQRRQVDVAGDHQDGVVGGVPAAIEGLLVGGGQATHLVRPADRRQPVGMVEKEGGLQPLAELRGRIVVGPLPALLDDDLALRPDHGVGDLQIGHAVGLEPHRQRQVLERHRRVEGGVVLRGVGVLLAADPGDRGGVLARRHRLGAAEHQVLEEMRGARLADRIVGGADLVEHHLGDDRGAVVGHQHDLQPVGQREGLGLEHRGGGRAGQAHAGQEEAGQEHPAASRAGCPNSPMRAQNMPSSKAFLR